MRKAGRLKVSNFMSESFASESFASESFASGSFVSEPFVSESSPDIDSARNLELLYWSEEQGVLELIRPIAILPPEVRHALLSFLTSTSDPRSISVDMPRDGELRLSSSSLTSRAA
jgi:hypothetical protein